MHMNRAHRYFHKLTAAVGVTITLSSLTLIQHAAAAATAKPINPLWPHNYMLAPSAAARNVPLQFYRDIAHHDDSAAEARLTDGLKPSYEHLGQMHYFAELQHPAIYELQDITSHSGVLRRETDTYAAVKVYLGVLTAHSPDPIQQTALNQLKYHRFVVVKITPDSPWQLDDDEALSSAEVSSLQR